MSQAEFDADLLETAVTRKPVLEALAGEPHHRQELQDELDLSKTTCHRIVRSFDDYGLLRRTDRGYALTPLGRRVADAVDRYDETVRAAVSLEPMLGAFADAPVEFPVELFADATVTRPDSDDPSMPVDRACELFFESDSNWVRTLDCSQFIPPVFMAEVFEAGIEEGLEGEFVFPASVARERIERFEEYHRMIPEADAAIRYLIHDGVPFGMSLYEGHVDVRAYDDETGAPVMLVDTDDSDAVAWAEDVFELYRERAKPPSAVEEIPDWLPEPDVEF